MRGKMSGLFGLASMVLGAASALASPLLPGQAQFANQAAVSGTPKYTEGLPAYFSPGNIVAQLNAPNVGVLGGLTTSTVYKNPSTNLLTFDYVVSAAATNTRVIVRGALDGPWTNVAITNVGADGSGISGTGDPAPEWTNGDPNYIERDPATQGPAIQWRTGAADGSIGTVIGPGNTSAHVWFETDAIDFRQSLIGYLDSGSTGSADILVPAGVIPEPVTLALLGMGALGMATRRRSK